MFKKVQKYGITVQQSRHPLINSYIKNVLNNCGIKDFIENGSLKQFIIKIYKELLNDSKFYGFENTEQETETKTDTNIQEFVFDFKLNIELLIKLKESYFRNKLRNLLLKLNSINSIYIKNNNSNNKLKLKWKIQIITTKFNIKDNNSQNWINLESNKPLNISKTEQKVELIPIDSIYTQGFKLNLFIKDFDTS